MAAHEAFDTQIAIDIVPKKFRDVSVERKKCNKEMEPLPPELQPLSIDNEDGQAEVNATDPVVQLFLKRQRRMKEVRKRREANVLERFNRFSVKKYYMLRRAFLMTSIALRNLAFGLPPLEQLQKEVAFANMKEPEAQAAHEENLKAEVGHDEL